MIVLGIETSCDETAVAVVDDHPGRGSHIRANLIRAQLAEHRPYGGVVPEIAARAHLDHIDELIRSALDEAGADYDAVDGVAAAAGPGLIGGLTVGTMAAKGIAWSVQKPFIAVNHLEAHALTARLSDAVAFPYLLLLVSGGHSQLVACAGVGEYRVLGASRDDAAGEAFDKTAKLLGLAYPGGPQLAQIAAEGRPGVFAFPRPMLDRAGLEFSFSGLKTAVRHALQGRELTRQLRADVARAVQEAIVDTLIAKALRALEYTGLTALVVSGGVSANRLLRERLSVAAAKAGGRVYYPRIEFSTDNAAMIAVAGLKRLEAGQHDDLGVQARAQWPLESLPAVSA